MRKLKLIAAWMILAAFAAALVVACFENESVRVHVEIGFCIVTAILLFGWALLQLGGGQDT